MTDLQTHAISIELADPVAEAVPAGTEFAVKLKITCAAGCDLAGVPVAVVEPGDPAAKPLPSGDIVLRAPRDLGEHLWRIDIPAHESGGAHHTAASLDIRVNSKPHGTSLAVWDVPSPVVTGRPFQIKAGAKSSSACELKGCAIEVCDESGAVIARGTLGDAPWPGTTALYWAELELTAPACDGICNWSVRFSASELNLPHDSAAATFGVVTVKPPEHRLTVKVFEQETRTPIAEAQVRLGPHRAVTDAAGLAAVALPKGRYELTVWKAEYDIAPLDIEVTADTDVDVEAVPVPDDDPYAPWKM